MELEKLSDLLCCPACRGPLRPAADAWRCPACPAAYPCRDGRLVFREPPGPAEGEAGRQAELMAGASLAGRVNRGGRRLVSSDYTPRDHVAEFVRDLPPGAILAELGAGNRRLTPETINLDLFPLPAVDLVGDVARSPFRDGSLDAVVLDSVLEHVPAPWAVAAEVRRILKPGGRAVCVVPWVFPYHGFPRNYFHISADGLQELFRDFSSCRVETNIGPTAALTNLVSEYFALALTRRRGLAFTCWKGFFLLPLFLFKYLDRFWPRRGKSRRLASHLCALVTR